MAIVDNVKVEWGEEMENNDNYKSLLNALDLAHKRASVGKGKKRHADNNKFEEQPICTEMRLMNTTIPAVYQVRKKAIEQLRFDTSASINEWLDVIVYSCAAVIVLLEKLEQEKINTTNIS